MDSLIALAFYSFAIITLLSAIMVICARNPVHSVLFLILTFFSAAGLFVMLGAEFLAMLLVIVYVGAVAVLFLFVVMMLDIDIIRLRKGFLNYLPIGGLISFCLLIELLLVLGVTGEMEITRKAISSNLSNTEALGAVLYTEYIYLFQVAGAILLTAMIGAIVLTLRTREDVKRQNINKQNKRSKKDSVELVDVQIEEGV
ncbi:MAG: NADH-quinone oxidoreductase subunit J [Parvibaculales bacterium]